MTDTLKTSEQIDEYLDGIDTTHEKLSESALLQPTQRSEADLLQLLEIVKEAYEAARNIGARR
jgi:hypothetical protein